MGDVVAYYKALVFCQISANSCNLAHGTSPDGAASIVNIGTNGALLETVALVDKDAGPIRIAVSFELYGVPVSLDLSAEVRAAKTEPAADGFPRHQCGVEFKDLQPNDRLALGSLLWFQMHEHPDHAA